MSDRANDGVSGGAAEGGSESVKLKDYHAAVWSEPVVMELGRPGRRGLAVPEAEEEGKW